MERTDSLNSDAITNDDNKVASKICIALCGNPNSGKTCMFNELTHSHEHVGNWPGVTVEKIVGVTKFKGFDIEVVDLPGTYGLTAVSLEEQIVRNFIIRERPDIVVNVIDSTNIERNLYLTEQLVELGIRGVVALNMDDEARNRGIVINTHTLAELLGMPVVNTVACRGEGLQDLLESVVSVHEGKNPLSRHIHIPFGREVEEEIQEIQKILRKDPSLTTTFSTRWLSVKLLEHDRQIVEEMRSSSVFAPEIEAQVEKSDRHIEEILGDESESILADGRYGFISGIIHEACHYQKPDRLLISEQIDRILINRVLGLPIFLFFLWLMFYATFAIGRIPVKWLEWLVGRFSIVVAGHLPEGVVRDLVVNGIIAGMGSVIVYLPNILMLFFFIALFEDTGYMARAAFTMDRLMHFVGLHGKSFIPLVMGFGCNVPAIMAARSLENRTDRILTILINPLISCSARLPVFVLVAGACFGGNAGNVIYSIYLLSILLAVGMGRLFRKTLFKGETSSFVLELPPYRIPLFKSVVIHMWENGSIFLKKVAGVIFFASIIIWFLSSFPVNSELSGEFKARGALLQERFEMRTHAIEQEIASSSGESDRSLRLKEIELLKRENREETQRLHEEFNRRNMETSVLGRLGRALEPMVRPLGFGWRESIALLTGFSSKEIMISTLSILYHAEEKTTGAGSSLDRIIAREWPPLNAYSFLVFTLIYIPCIGTLAVIIKELGSYKWGLFVMGYTLTLAWILSFLIYQVGRLLGLG
jgi:ferrous iron transport protein B